MLEKFQAPKYNEENSILVSEELSKIFSKRRTIRKFSSYLPSIQIVENAIDAARFSPSGANRQPWSFVLISTPVVKKEMRELAEKEEKEFYVNKPNEQWIKDLDHLHTNEIKSFIEEAPYLIVIFYNNYDLNEKGEVKKNYYAKESVGIATGMLISALHLSGLASLTYTPTRMQFLREYFKRPKEEKPFMVLSVGLAHEDAEVPVLSKKSIKDILKRY